MKHFLEHTKILAVIVALFDVVMIIFAHSSIPHSLVAIGAGIFFFFVVFVTVYRPLFGLALFVGTIPFETVTVLSFANGASLRPYQLVGVALCVAVVWSFLHGSAWTQRHRFVLADFLVIGLAVLSFIGTRWALDPSVSLHYAVIFASFVVLYGAVRCIITDEYQVVRMLPIVIVSGCIVSAYAIGQNILFLHGAAHHEFMPGRPNAFFTEPDWLGLYLVFVFAMCVAYLYEHAHHRHVWRFFDLSLWSATVLVTVAMIITVARSAWVGTAAVSLTYLLLVFGMKKYKMFTRHALWLASVTVVSVIIALYAPITHFELGNRIQSTTTGLQEITVSCNEEPAAMQLAAQQKITDVAVLPSYGCQHIDLEDIAAEQLAGHTVIKIMRDDPNVSVRTMIYERVVHLIRAHPLTGYGWGSSGILLGTDEHGTPLNASNIFLETALSIGVIGAGMIVFLCGWLMIRAGIVLYGAHEEQLRVLAVCGILGIVAIIIPNLFNAGLFVGYVWFFLGLVAILGKKV